MKISRNQSHFIVMTVIYNELNDFHNGGNTLNRDATEMISELCELPIEQCDDFVINCVAVSLREYGEIKSKFVPNLNNWTWDRIPLLTQAILLMSYAHYYYIKGVDKKVVIDIAVSLAKKYIEDRQAKFINAILDKVLQ